MLVFPRALVYMVDVDSKASSARALFTWPLVCELGVAAWFMSPARVSM